MSVYFDNAETLPVDQSLDTAEQLDFSLLRRIAGKDLEALRELHLRYQHRVALYLAQLTRRPELAQRLASDSWVEVWKQAPSFRGRTRIAIWLYRIAHEQGLDTAGTDDSFEPASLQQRAVLALAYGLGLSCEDVAIVMRCSVAAVRILMISACNLEYPHQRRSLHCMQRGRNAFLSASTSLNKDFR